jgi:TonB-dependent SusC/RagA subfamily outer membrane receptor
MKKIIHNYAVIVFWTCAFSLAGSAQNPDYAGTKEKIYIQTDHVFFKQGETIFFKIYVVSAKDQKPSQLSKTVYVELINPAGNVLTKMIYKVENGTAEGSYEFGEEAVGGVYKIKGYTTWMKNEDESAFFTKDITLQKVIAPRILMKLDFPEKGYGAGTEGYANFSMRNLSDQPIKFYVGKFAVLIGSQVMITDDFKTDQQGKAKIKFTLPVNLRTNDALMNIVVNYDSYTEAISRSIPIVLNRVDLQFMPEGGTFVNGITTNVAFKALNENGKAADINGEIWDNKGNKITTFESYHFGMGKFLFTPRSGELYKVKIISPANISQEFQLPRPSETGVVMNVSKTNRNVTIKLMSTDEMQVTLTGQTKGIHFYTKNIVLQKGENDVEIDPVLFPVGIARFTLFAQNDLPLAERLVFLNEDKILKITITADKKRYMPREKVTLNIKTVDESDKPIPSDLSLAVVDDKLWSFADDKQDHILSWVLMSSELRGKIEEPQFYFKKDEPKALPALDLIMLTHGYRYFDYIEDVQNTGQLKFTPDQENILSGVVIDAKGIPANASVFLIKAATGEKGMQIRTGEDGSFFFSNLESNTRYYVIAQSLNKEKHISIKILQNGIGYNPRKNLPAKPIKTANGEFVNILKDPLPKPTNKAMVREQTGLLFQRATHLEEVVVVGYGAIRKKDVTGAIAMLNAKQLSGINNVGFALQGKVAGVQVINNANPGVDAKIRIRGAHLAAAGQPLFVINGTPVEQADLNTINPNDIESIAIWKDAAAVALYGAKAANGVIVIESRKFRNERIRLNFTNEYSYTSQLVTVAGPTYTVARRFYAPKYSDVITRERKDFRETIYWNPVIQTDKNGTATVEFYNSDASTTFRVIAEGIAWNGKPGRAETTYAAQNAMSVDVKIPPYLTVGDRAMIPLVIKNNRNDDLRVSIEISAPAKFNVGKFDNSIVINADSSRQILIPLEAVAEIKGRINFTVKNQFGIETISLPITASDKGFPMIQTFSGNKSGQDSFVINKPVPGTLKARLKLFKNVEGQLLDGIESMLREPYGCFEQTSSTTYPNIYVLKYLRESGRSNPEIEKKALDYIQKGYNRLIGFETPQNGFEWFGHTPPHEALTAYGLLEFTDMKEFIKVDEPMLRRTKDFLMKRRDGKGSFRLASGGYDRFASVPDEIANIYIVYALTQAGIGHEIQREYENAVKKALESNDGYQMAMMALAANNMKNGKDYDQLMLSLRTLFQKSNLSSETSIVNSRDASLKVETASLYALALMRGSSPDIGLVANLIAQILSEKTYYGYGSTQATVLALHAIVEYSKLIGKINENEQVHFVVNSKVLKSNDEIEKNLLQGKNEFAVTYSQADKNIPYSFEVSYNTLTPPASEKAALQLKTSLKKDKVSVGETVRMEIEVTNQKATLQPMTIAKIGLPAGLSVQPWQLKEIMEKDQVAYYEIFDNYLVFYWMGFSANETKKINMDLKAEIKGNYTAKASTAYLYYTPEYKTWNDGLEVEIEE